MSNLWHNFDLSSSIEYKESPFLGVFTMRPADIAARIKRPNPPFVQKPLYSERNSDSSDSNADEIPILSIGFKPLPTIPLVC